MRVESPSRRPKAESVVPMINVVFLLLVFFLMTAQLTPPDSLDVTPPEAASDSPAQAGLVLYLDAEGRVAFRDGTGTEAALAALAAEREAACGACTDPEAAPPVILRADAGAPARAVAALLPRLAALGIGQADLITVPQ